MTDLVYILEQGRLDFMDAVDGISQEQARARPTPGCWSVLECIEHVVIVEDRFLSWILDGSQIAPQPDSDKELRLFSTIRSRLTKFQAPEPVLPQGRYRTLEEAVAAFQAARDRSVQFVKDRGEPLYAIGAKHPYFGDVNGAEMIQLIDGHARRHAEQIRETCEAIGEARRAGPGSA
jgi:hypothetical protein